MKTNRDETVHYLKHLRDQIIGAFESLEIMGGSTSRFQRTPWTYQQGSGGGEMAVIRGQVFEKAAVNWSGVYGSQLPGEKSQKPTSFFATGVSLITHMRNPKAPTVHFNIRYIEKLDSDKNIISNPSDAPAWWLGGGFDLTPMGFDYPEDTEHFHLTAKKSLDPFGLEVYPTLKKNAAEYFYIKHRKRERGVGGIFFDYMNTGDRARDFALWHAVGDHFLESIMPIYHRRLNEPYSEEDRKVQLERRAHYVEFNLLYDRGTRFGFESGGNPEAILCSMPPLAAW